MRVHKPDEDRKLILKNSVRHRPRAKRSRNMVTWKSHSMPHSMASVRQSGAAPPRPTALCHVSGGWGICFRDLSRNLHPCSHSLNRAAGDGVSVLSFPLCTATMWWHWTPWDTQNRQELRGPLTLSRWPYKNWLWVMNLHRIPLRLRGCSSETIWWANPPVSSWHSCICLSKDWPMAVYYFSQRLRFLKIQHSLHNDHFMPGCTPIITPFISVNFSFAMSKRLYTLKIKIFWNGPEMSCRCERNVYPHWHLTWQINNPNLSRKILSNPMWSQMFAL